MLPVLGNRKALDLRAGRGKSAGAVAFDGSDSPGYRQNQKGDPYRDGRCRWPRSYARSVRSESPPW